MTDERLTGLLQSMRSDILNDQSLTDKKRVASTGSSAAGSEGSVVINKSAEPPAEVEQPLRIRTKNLSADLDNEDDDFTDYVIEPALPPPKELEPGKLYALFQFSGDDPSHCELDRDDAVVLLNDQDNYWWLVRKDFDGKIGFAPAECLETYDERLARLNCYKNEKFEKESKETSEYPALEKQKPYTLLNKSVTFSNEVTVALATYVDSETASIMTKDNEYDENMIVNDPDEDTDEEDGDDEQEHLEDGFDHYGDDFNYEEKPYVGADDEIVSDNFPVTPLVLAKKPNRFEINPATMTFPESDTEEESPLVAPTAFFSVNNYSGSIGEYSPSSSEFDSPENTPPLSQFRRKPPKDDYSTGEAERGINRSSIPLSKGTRDIAHSIKLLDDLINDELNTSNSLDSENDTEEEEADITLTYDSDNTNKLSSPITMDETKKNLSNITDSTFTNSNGSLQRLNSSLTSVEDEHILLKVTHEVEASTCELKLEPSPEIHPEIHQIFRKSLNKMDELSERLRLLNEQFD